LVEKIRAASRVTLTKREIAQDGNSAEPEPIKALSQTTNKIIAIGASTGGTEALKKVLIKMPPNSPGIIIVQHMPANFTKAFASRLNDICQISVKEAEDNDSVIPGN